MTKLKYILLLLIIALLPQISRAKTVKIGELYYELNEQELTAKVTHHNIISSYKNYEGLKNVIIPSEIKNNSKSYKVTSIGNWAFWHCRSLISIDIPNSINSIGESAFEECSSLMNIVIPNSVTLIGKKAFSHCSSLTGIEIPNSVTSIGKGAFYDCSNLTRVNISNLEAWCQIYFDSESSNPLCYAHRLYLNGQEIKDLVIPNTVHSIGDLVFSGCKSLKSVTIPNSVTSIGTSAFKNCSNLTSVTIGSSITAIEFWTFKNCTSLTSIEIPNSVTSIGDGAFEDCSSLRKIELPKSVTSIGSGAFEGCSSLSSIELPKSVTSIESNAFFGCRSLKQIIAPKNLAGRLKAKYDRIDIITTESYYASKERDKKNQKTVQGVNSDKNLADANSSSKKNNEVNKEKAKNDKSTSAKKSEFQELNDNMLSWDEFYKKNRKAKLTYENVSQIEAYINKEIEKWQVKDEFETTNEWKARVNETTRQQKVRELSAPLIEQHNREVAQINEEQKRLAQEYEKYKQDLIEEYYQTIIGQAISSFSSGDFSLNPYDADNGTFLIRSSKYGDILLPVLGRDEARSFKENWDVIKKSIKPEFVPNGEDVALTKLIFTNNGKQYVYDSHTEANYAVTDVKYNFKPVELADISLDDINTNLPALANADISSQIISKTSNEAITPQKVQPSKNTVVASDRSDVDYAIPSGSQDISSNTFAVIIANEDYSSNVRVPYASNDGEIMARYLTSAVGLPENHVKVYRNATYGKVAEAVNYIEKLGEAYGDKMNLIFYYAGHGVPDEKTKTALLLPVDGNPSISKTCYSVDELVKNLGNLKANNVILMIDACFSGTTRNDDMLVAASGNRGVRLRSNDIAPIGNMVVLSATQGDETAYPYDREQHGLFTYFLLKKLQENKGNVTLGELADYVIENVKQTSIVNNGKLQTPTVTVSPSLVGSWRDIPLK